MSTNDRRKRLQDDGYTFHSEFRIGEQLIAEFYTKEGGVFHWFPPENPYDLDGNEWKKAAAMNEYRRLCKEMEKKDGSVSVASYHRAHWPRLLRSGHTHDAHVVRFYYYGKPCVAVSREALTQHFDEAMNHVEELLDVDEHPERRRIFAEAGPTIFFGEGGTDGKLEREYGVAS